MTYTKDWILAKAKTELSVHKYSYSHEKLRKKTKRICKDGVLTMVKQDKDKFYYRLVE